MKTRRTIAAMFGLMWAGAAHAAHGFSVLTLYAERTTSEADSHGFLVVPLFDKDKGKDKEVSEIVSSGTADCMLHDFRLVRTENEDVQIILADRDLGKSADEDAKVTFKYFDLQVPATSDSNEPPYFFKLAKTTPAKQTYCDVGEAFQKELGLGPYQKD